LDFFPFVSRLVFSDVAPLVALVGAIWEEWKEKGFEDDDGLKGYP
jgi:hypothetical protein